MELRAEDEFCFQQLQSSVGPSFPRTIQSLRSRQRDPGERGSQSRNSCLGPEGKDSLPLGESGTQCIEPPPPGSSKGMGSSKGKGKGSSKSKSSSKGKGKGSSKSKSSSKGKGKGSSKGKGKGISSKGSSKGKGSSKSKGSGEEPLCVDSSLKDTFPLNAIGYKCVKAPPCRNTATGSGIDFGL
jgi:hypothetical protein